MQLLLDTHAFLWYISGDPRLIPRIRDEIRNRANDVFLSPVSLWEIAVKYELGKLALPAPPNDFIPRQRQHHEIASLPLDEASVMLLSSLPPIHKDPFDRMLICQALANELVMVSSDDAVQAYPVAFLR